MGYYIANQGVQQGPFELEDLPNQGLSPDSLVWTEGMPDWQRAQDHPQVATLLVSKTPSPPASLAPPPPPGPVPIQPLQTMPYHTPMVPPTNGMAVASMVLGIVAFPMSCFYGMGIVSAILAVVFGFLARARIRRGEASSGDAMALAGIICGFSLIALAGIGILVAILFAVGVASHRIGP